MADNGVPKADATPLAELRPHPRNYRRHPDEQIAHIMASITEHGVYRNIVATLDGTILAGHGVFEAAKRLQLSHVPVVRVDVDPNSPRAIRLLAGDNEIGRLADQDDRLLSELLKGLKDDDPAGLLGTGYDDAMLANLVFVTRPASEIESFDAAAEWVGMPEFGYGSKEAVVLNVQFRTREDRQAFLERAGIAMDDVAQMKDGRLYTTWFPPRVRDDLSSVKFR